MNNEELNVFCLEIQTISKNFEEKAWTEKVRMLKDDFKLNSLESPNYYMNSIGTLGEVLREARLLFLYSLFNRVCLIEGKLYYFDTPYQANMRYDAVMKKDETFYLLDEDGHLREIFTSEAFMTFIDDQYWELYEEE